MESQNQLNYNRIAQAINYILENFKSQPSLDDIARELNLSPFHFQRLFTEWAGTSPKNFLQYISLEYAKKQLKDSQKSLFITSENTGLSSTGRLHDLFVKIEGMTPGEYKNGGQNLSINYTFEDTHFGKILITSTIKGICHLMFVEDEEASLEYLKSKYPNAMYYNQTDEHQQNALLFFNNEEKDFAQIRLHLKGTNFQLKVWESLLKIPEGRLSTYGTISRHIQQPTSARAVGTAIGSNPVAFLIPCHRVIQSSGLLGGYMWGNTRKTALIGWEAARIQ